MATGETVPPKNGSADDGFGGKGSVAVADVESDDGPVLVAEPPTDVVGCGGEGKCVVVVVAVGYNCSLRGSCGVLGVGGGCTVSFVECLGRASDNAEDGGGGVGREAQMANWNTATDVDRRPTGEGDSWA